VRALAIACGAFFVPLTVVLAGCNTTGSRIREHQALFESLPDPTRQNLRDGVIGVGYTPEMVYIALGEPDRKTDVVTGEVAAQVWTWWRRTPGVGVSVGGWNALGSNVGMGSRVALGEQPRRETQTVVEFRSGQVYGFERLAGR
jgi:hypothetical protein